MNRNKHLLLWSSLGVLLLLVVAAVEENFLKDWRQLQAATRTASGPAEVRLRQIVAPKLGVTDRCVSCHIGMAPGEEAIVDAPLAVAKPHPPVVHDPAEFGCTVCHAGQGRATDQADAHGEIHFWPQPMIPLEYSYAGCGSCHTHVRVPNQQQLDHGERLIARLDCLACHRIDGRGGTLRPGGVGGMEGPDLSRVGAAGYDPQWYAKHLDQHQVAQEGVWKSTFGPISESDRQVVDDYLASRVAAPQLVAAKSLFHSLGCRGCHKIGGVGGDDGPDLTLAGDKDPARIDFAHVDGEPTIANWHVQHLRHPARIVLGSQMPAFGLNDTQIDQLTFYLLSLRRSSFPEAYWPRDRVLAERFGDREFSDDGGTLYGTFCAACHGPLGKGQRFPGTHAFPAIGNPDFLAVASDRFLEDTIQHGRPGRRMPAWGEQQGDFAAPRSGRSLGFSDRKPALRNRSPSRPNPDGSRPTRTPASDCTSATAQAATVPRERACWLLN
jgi:mono/diheme cytochrome c family protein